MWSKRWARSASLSQEIRAATRRLSEDLQWLEPVADVRPPWLVRLSFAAPAWPRDRLYCDRVLCDPFRVKRTMGTVLTQLLTSRTKVTHARPLMPQGQKCQP